MAQLDAQLERLREKINDARRVQKNLELQIGVKTKEQQRLQRQTSQLQAQYESRTAGVRELFNNSREQKLTSMLNDAYGPFWDKIQPLMGQPARAVPRPHMNVVTKAAGGKKKTDDDPVETAVILATFALATYNK